MFTLELLNFSDERTQKSSQRTSFLKSSGHPVPVLWTLSHCWYGQAAAHLFRSPVLLFTKSRFNCSTNGTKWEKMFLCLLFLSNEKSICQIKAVPLLSCLAHFLFTPLTYNTALLATYIWTQRCWPLLRDLGMNPLGTQAERISSEGAPLKQGACSRQASRNLWY